MSPNLSCWKMERDQLGQLQKRSLWCEITVILLETFPGHFLNDIPNSHNASSKTTWTSTILPGNCKNWDLYWPWSLMKLAYHYKNQKHRLWLCLSFHFPSICNTSIPNMDITHRFQHGFGGKTLVHCLYHQVCNFLSLTCQELLSWRLAVPQI